LLIRERSTTAEKIPPHAAPNAWSEQQHEAEIVENADPMWLSAVRAAESKKASDIRVLDLRDVTSFTDFFVICTGANARQIQAIAEEVEVQLKRRGDRPISLEGVENAEWVLADYGDYIVHIFSKQAREYYDLERLWRHAKDVSIPNEELRPRG
jgi:ribosome-associated protein